MKTSSNFLIVLFILSLLSCNLEKRIYRNGTYIRWIENKSIPQNKKASGSISYFETKTIKTELTNETLTVSTTEEDISNNIKDKNQIISSLNILTDEPVILTENKILQKSKTKDPLSDRYDLLRMFFLLIGVMLSLFGLLILIINQSLGLTLLILGGLCLLLAISPDFVFEILYSIFMLFYQYIIEY